MVTEEGDDASARAALGVIENELRYTERRAREHHVTGIPNWLVNDEQLVVGPRSRTFFMTVGHALSSTNHEKDQASTGRPA
jgi:predicted DsbA family dithiol-disulfide isomerase